MTTLPVINTGTGKRKAKVVPSSSHRSTRFLTWREKDNLKQKMIREENPTMAKVDTSIYRNSYKHNLCVKMLKDGFHKSFEELFELIENRRKERLEAGVDSILWKETPLDVQEEKLDQLWLHLTKAESAMRIGRWDDVYTCRYSLAQYFLEKNDAWLSDHFFESSLDASKNIRLDGGRREAEAHCNMGLVCERNKNHKEAALHMEEFHQLSLDRTWTNEDDVTHSQVACRHLSRIYSTLAEETTDLATTHTFLHKAYDMAKDGNDILQEAGAALNLGRNYEQKKESETAIEYLNQCLRVAQDTGDHHLIGEACEALAKSYQTQGSVSRSIEFLEVFAQSSRSSGRNLEFIQACQCLGTIYNTLGYYDKSVGHYASAYETVNEIDNYDEESSVLLGVAKGNELLKLFKTNMELPELHMMPRIVEWKDERVDNFGKPIPTHVPTPPTTPLKIADPTQPYRDVDPEKASL